jgi:hypothetical protein
MAARHGSEYGAVNSSWRLCHGFGRHIPDQLSVGHGCDRKFLPWREHSLLEVSWLPWDKFYVEASLVILQRPLLYHCFTFYIFQTGSNFPRAY